MTIFRKNRGTGALTTAIFIWKQSLMLLKHFILNKWTFVEGFTEKLEEEIKTFELRDEAAGIQASRQRARSTRQATVAHDNIWRPSRQSAVDSLRCRRRSPRLPAEERRRPPPPRPLTPPPPPPLVLRPPAAAVAAEEEEDVTVGAPPDSASTASPKSICVSHQAITST